MFKIFVSIPSNGSIQFLRNSLHPFVVYAVIICLNPLKRVNSILTLPELTELRKTQVKVSIPSNGSIQFLPYRIGINPLPSLRKVSIPSNGSIQFLLQSKGSLKEGPNYSLNPLKRVNSILTIVIHYYYAFF